MPSSDNSLRSFSLDTLASALTLARDASDAHSPGGLPAVEGEFPVLSYAQERLLFMDRLTPGNPFYNAPFGLTIEGPLDPDALAAAWLDIIRRHETLRSKFPHDKHGAPCVRFIPAERCALVLRDLRHAPEEERTAIIEAAKEEEISWSFSLSEGPLVRGTLFILDECRFVFLYNFHHCVFDGWSLSVFNAELFQAYEARSQGREPGLPPLAATHGQFAAWQRQKMEGADGQREYAWWREYLSGIEDLDLYADNPRPAVQRFRGDLFQFTVPLAVREKLENIAERLGASPFMLWMSLYSLLLGRYSGQRRFTVGSSLAGRTHPATEGMIGFLVNNMVVKLENIPDDTFMSHLNKVKQSVLTSFAHAELPFQMLAQGLGRHCDLSRNPVYQAAMTYQNTPRWNDAPKDLMLNNIAFTTRSTHVDLELLLWETPDGLLCSVLYNSDLFERSTVEFLFRTFRALAEALADAPERCVGDLFRDRRVLPPLPHRPSSLAEGPPESGAYISPWERLKAIAAHKPDAPAFILSDDMPESVPIGAASKPEGTEQVSWGRLIMMSEQVSSSLASLPVGPGRTTAILLRSGVEMLVATLAVWRRNGAWVLLDPDNPRPRILDTLRELRADCLVSTPDLTAALDLDVGEIQNISVAHAKNWREIAPEKEAEPPTPAGPEDIACLFSTSGSTGKPKGVPLRHGDIADRLQWEWSAYPLADKDIACMKASVSYSDFFFETYGALLSGTPLLLLGHSPARDVPRLMQKVEQYGVTKLVVVPSLLRTMHRITDGLAGRLQSLRYLRTSGEVLPHALAKDTLRAIPGLTLYSVYGSTEMLNPASFRCTVEALEDLPDDGVLPAGPILPGRKVAILDENGLPVPRGEVGTIFASGWGLSPGYVSGRGNEAFCMLNLDGSFRRWFNSGDLGFLDNKERLYFAGRGDHQLKVRGVRMEAEEIEGALRDVGGVPEAKVLVCEDAEANQRLIGFVLPGPGSVEDDGSFTTSLRRQLFEILPAVMVPDWIMVLDEWPRTPTGKVSDALLREKFTRRSALADKERSEAPGIPSDIARLWRDVLGGGSIDGKVTFFEAGGNSLLLVNLHHKLQQAFDRNFPLVALFQNPTVESQAKYLEGRIHVSRDAPAKPILQPGRSGLAARRGGISS